MAKSMVSGKPLSLMLQFATPLLLGNLLQQTYNIIDAAIVGQILGDKALAGFLGRKRWQVWEQAAVYSFWFWDSVWAVAQDLVFLLQSFLVQIICTR